MRQTLFYLLFAYRRFVRAKGKDGMGEWKARFLILWVQAQSIFCLVWLTQRQWVESINPILGGLILIVPCVIWEEYLLADRSARLRYFAKFRSWPPLKRYTTDACVIAFSLLIAVAPLLIDSLYRNQF